MSIELEDVRRLRLQPGDTLVLRCAESLSHDMVTALTENMKAAFPGHRVVVLDAYMTLEVVEEADGAS